MRYRLMVDSNAHYMDESERYTAGEYDHLEDAVATAKRIVDRSLLEFASRGRRADELYEYYCLFGDDPFIVGAGEIEFSAREYARERCRELGGDSWYLLVALGRYHEAEPLMLNATPQTAEADPYGVNIVARAEFYEAWGDAAGQTAAVLAAYREADRYFSIFASGATSGGEGTARMTDVLRVRAKLERMNDGSVNNI